MEDFALAPLEPETKPAIPPTFTPPSPIADSVPGRRVSSFSEIYNSTKSVEWVIKGLLPTKGLMYIGARSGTGKTILALQIAIDLVFDRETMSFKRGENLGPQKILILSLEMGEEEMKERLRAMYPELSEEDMKLLSDSIIFYADPEPFKLWTSDHVVELVRLIMRNKITGVIIDSASVSFAQSLKDDSQVNDTINSLYMIRNRLNAWMIIVSHTRKLPAGIVGNMEDVTVDELFGHSGVAQSASSVLLLHHDKKPKDKAVAAIKAKVVWLMNVKARFTAEFPPFMTFLPLEPPLLFRRRDPIALPPLSPEKKAEANKAAKELPFGAAFQAIDFKLIGGVEDDDA